MYLSTDFRNHFIVSKFNSMQFLYPWFLWGLLAISLPVIIHLFNFRRYKKIYFTNVKFLKDVHYQSKSKSRLKEILILVCRCLTIIALTLAFSQPFIPKKDSINKVGRKQVSIFIDNSFSTNNINKQGPIFEIEKNKAREIVNSLNSNDKIQIITNDFEGKHQRFNTKEDAIQLIDELKISASSKKLSDIIKRQTDLLKSAGSANNQIYYLSDFQSSVSDLTALKSDSSISVHFIPLTPQKTNNVYIDTCWFETPIQQKGFIQKLHVIIKNSGDQVIENGTAKLYLNDIQLALSTYSLDANSKTENIFTFECKKNGVNNGKVSIEDYPINYDNELYFTFNASPRIKVVQINANDNSNSEAFAKLFNSDSLFNYIAYNEKNVNYSEIKKSNILILNELGSFSSGLLNEVTNFQNKKGSLIIIPNKQIDFISYNQLLSQCKLPNLNSFDTTTIKTDKIEIQTGFFDGVFEKTSTNLNLPNFKGGYVFKENLQSNFEKLLSSVNGGAILSRSKNTLNDNYFFNSPLNIQYSNFVKHALFVPIFYKMCFNSIQPEPLFYLSGKNIFIKTNYDFNQTDIPPVIKQLNSQFELIPEFKLIENKKHLYIRGTELNPGYYNIQKADSIITGIAFNFDKLESNLEYFNKTELAKKISNLNQKNLHIIDLEENEKVSEAIENVDSLKLWKIFLILSLFFILIESLIIRFLK